MKPMRIVSLTAENIKRLRAVSIKPDGSIVEITGRNGAGKSSVLDAIAMALGGKTAQPSKPMRHGSSRAEVVVDLGELIVRRTWTADDKTYLSVESADGAKFPSPQAILDKLVGQLAFDPLAFSRMAPRDQVATLKQVAGLDFTKLDQRRQETFDRRTGINRELASAEAMLKTMPIVAAPDQEVSITELIRMHDEAKATFDKI
jgi:energy-coupling factor transporter ATP-binding protein EcfA2